jgi:flap endonuclease-1
MKNKQNVVISHIIGLLNKTLKLFTYGIIPVFVFDGRPPDIKKKILTMRKDVKAKAMERYNTTEDAKEKIKYFKKCVSITKEQLNDCRELLTLMGLPYIDASEEADSVLADLCKQNLVYAVLTEDMDILTFGAPRIIRNVFTHDKELLEINLPRILSTLNITHNEFIELCIYFGCDYCQITNTNITNIEIYNIYKNNKKILNRLVGCDEKEYDMANEYFTTNYNKINTYNIQYNYPDINKLTKLLSEKYNFNTNSISFKISKLVYYYNKFSPS